VAAPSPSRALQAIAFRQNIPLSVQLELTASCDHSCAFCYKPRSPAADQLTTEEVVGVLDTLAAMGTLYLQLTGGEATLRDDFRAIAEHASHKNFRIELATNGTRMDREMTDWAAALPIHHVQMSLHSTRAELHDELVGSPGSHEKVLGAAGRLRSAGVNVVLACVVTERNLEELDDMLALGRSMGVPVVFDPRLRPDARFGGRGDDAWQGPDRRVLKAVLSRQDVAPEFLSDPDKVPTEPGHSLCAAGRTRMRIDERGDVFACSFMAYPVGNVRDGLAEVWRDSTAVNHLRQVKFDASKCSSCDLVDDCAPCPGRHLEDTGDMLDPSPSVCWEAALRRKVRRSRQ